MKDILKKIDLFMLKHGGYALLVATIATVFFFAVLQWASDYMGEETKELEIQIDEQGCLYVDYQYDDKEKVYILWETDGGTLRAENKTDTFNNQEDGGYYCYGLSDEKISWSPEDADGYVYNTATVRAVLYEKQEENIYKIENYVLETTITVTMEENQVKKTEDRYFSNPVREGAEENWSQIYCINEGENYVTYRYRTGASVKEDYILCWQSEHEILSETDYVQGYLPECTINKEKKNMTVLKGSTLISCPKSNSSSLQIEAYLIESGNYNKEELEEKEQLYKAEIEIK